MAATGKTHTYTHIDTALPTYIKKQTAAYVCPGINASSEAKG